MYGHSAESASHPTSLLHSSNVPSSLILCADLRLLWSRGLGALKHQSVHLLLSTYPPSPSPPTPPLLEEDEEEEKEDDN